MSKTCAECAKPITINQASYYALDPFGFGRTYHSACGDPMGIKALKADNTRMREALDSGIQPGIEFAIGYLKLSPGDADKLRNAARAALSPAPEQ